MYRSIIFHQNTLFFSSRATTTSIRHLSSLPIHKLHSIQAPSVSCLLKQRREYGLIDNFKRIFKQELDKNKDLKESIEDLKKQKDALAESEIAKTVKKTVDTNKELIQKVKSSVSDYNVGEKALKGFENISDKIVTASDFIKDKSAKIPGFKNETKKDKKDPKSKKDAVETQEQTETDVEKTGEKPVEGTVEKTVETAEDTPTSSTTQPTSSTEAESDATEAAKKATAEDKEETTQQVVDIVPVTVPKKGWFNFSPKLSKTVDQIRLFVPNFSIVEFLQKANDVHKEFLIALNTKNAPLLTEISTDLLAERLTALWVKPDEEVDQCHVIENFDAELEDCDPEKPSLRLGFEAHLVLIRPDGTVLPITLPRGDTSTVVQVKGAFEWTFDQGNALINDFTCYHLDTIY